MKMLFTCPSAIVLNQSSILAVVGHKSTCDSGGDGIRWDVSQARA